MHQAERPEDAGFMRRALALAGRGWGRVHPNPLVGAVVVREDGVVVGEGWHAEYGGPHAEVEALRTAGEQAQGATMYVTLEPCAHHGKTPPCTDAVVAAGVKRLVYAVADPNPRAGGGADRLVTAGVEVVGGVEEGRRSRAERDLPARPRRRGPDPFVELKLALSLDARIADAEGRSNWITGPAARDEVHRLRAGHSAVVVGIGTVLADDPLLTVRGPVAPRVPPTRVVFDRRLRIPLTSRLVQTIGDAPLLVVHDPLADGEPAERLRERGATLVRAGSLDAAMRALKSAGIDSLFVEGGAALAASLIRDDLVDRLTLFYAPILLGPEGRAPFAGLPDARIDDVARWRTVCREAFGPDTMIRFAR
jgi:diaminohydroxyphosphoribosylaminopyrimidine deaminase / 5-amino-6-(5-phosphoribosylamino)uracil reductase